MQQDIFNTGNEKSKQKKELAIMKQGKQALTKEQKDFNRLITKIEKLRTDLDRIAATLDKQMEYYAANIHPLEQRIAMLRISCVKMFFPFYTGEKKFLTKEEKKVLKEIIKSDLNEAFSLNPDEPGEELKAIYKTVSGESYEDTKKNMFRQMKDEMEEQFREEGININLDGIDENTSEAEMMKKLREMQEDLERQAEEMTEKQAKKKKTKKQLEREERDKQIEEARKKSIGTIYKQLVKAFHPDLETDETIKLQKEDIMKQLTVAYEKNDLHTLLRLEMEWMHKENNDPAKLSNDKLGIYNEALKEQVMELEMQIGMQENHPRLAPLHRYADSFAPLHLINLKREKKDMEEMVSGLEDTEPKLKGGNALQYVKEIIETFKHESAAPDMDELLKAFLAGMR